MSAAPAVLEPQAAQTIEPEAAAAAGGLGEAEREYR